MTDEQFKVNFKPSYLTRGLKSKLTAQVDYINANFNRGAFSESIDMIDVMIHNLTYTREKIQKHKESVENQEAIKQRQKQALDNIRGKD